MGLLQPRILLFRRNLDLIFFQNDSLFTLLVIEWYPVDRVFAGFTWFNWVLPGFTGFYRVLLFLFRVQLGFIRINRVFMGLTGFYQVLLGFTRFHLALPGST